MGARVGMERVLAEDWKSSRDLRIPVIDSSCPSTHQKKEDSFLLSPSSKISKHRWAPLLRPQHKALILEMWHSTVATATPALWQERLHPTAEMGSVSTKPTHLTENLHTLTIYQTLDQSTAREIGKKKEMANNLYSMGFVTNCYSAYTKILSNSSEKRMGARDFGLMGPE